MASQFFDSVQKLYIAFYQRPADASGLVFWSDRLDAAAGSLNGIVDAFATSAEATALYGGKTNDVVLDEIYQALFNRAIDAQGKTFYTNGLNNGTFTIGTVVLDVLNGAQNSDAVAITNKLSTASSFTQKVDGRALTDPLFGTGTNFAVTYDTPDITSVRAFLAQVTADPQTVKQPTEIDNLLISIANPGDPILTATQAFDLTAALNEFTGGVGSDVFRATDKTFLQGLDKINGADGVDTIRILDVAGGALTDSQFAGVTNVETLETTTETNTLGLAAATAGLNRVVLLNQAAGQTTNNLSGFNTAVTVVAGTGRDDFTFDLTDAGNKTVEFTNSSVAETVANFDQVTATAQTGAVAGGTTISFESANVGNGTSGSLKIDGPNGDITLDNTGLVIKGSIADQFSVIGSDAQGNLITAQDRGDFQTVVLGTSGADTLTTTGLTGNAYLNAGAGDDTFNAAAAVGARHFVVGGAGNDTANIVSTAATGQVVASMGDGDDIVVVGAANVGGADHLGTVSLTLGDGANTVTFDDGLTLNTAVANNNDTLTGGAGRDTLIASSAQLTAVDNTVLNAVQSISAFEALTVSDALGAALTTSKIQAAIDTVTLNNASGGFAVTFDSAVAGTLNLAGAQTTQTGALTVVSAGLGTSDALTIANTAAGEDLDANAATALQSVNAFNGRVIAANEVETLTLNGSGNGTATTQTFATVTLTGTDLDGAGVGTELANTTVNFTGSNTFTGGAVQANAVNASGLTGTASVTLTTGATVAGKSFSVTGSANGDTVTLGTAQVTVDLAAGDDTLVANGNLNADTVAGGAGRDTLSIGAAVNAAQVLNVSGFEVLNFSAAIDQDMVQFVGNSTFDTVRVNTGVNVIRDSGASIATVNVANDTTSVAFNRLQVLANDALNVTVRAAQAGGDLNTTLGTLTANGEKSLTFDTGASLADGVNTRISNLTVTTLNAAAATSVTASGAGNFAATIADQAATDVLTSFSAASATGTVSFNASALTSNMTLTGSATAANTLTAGAGNDTLTGGSAADQLIGGAGTDTLTAGAGDDNLTGGAGADTLDLGTGSDTVNFEATLALNGLDTVNQFTAGDSNGATAGLGEGDVMNFFGANAATLNALFNVATATTDLSIAAGNNVYRIVDGRTTIDATNVKAVGTAANGELIVADGADAIVLQASAESSTAFNVYRVADTDAGGGTVTATVELLGVVNVTASTFGDLIAANVI